MLLDYEVAHNYADASCMELNYFIASSKKAGLTPFRFREGNGAAWLAKTVVFLRIVLPGVSAENANGIVTHIRRRPYRIYEQTSTLNPPRYGWWSKIIMNKFELLYARGFERGLNFQNFP